MQPTLSLKSTVTRRAPSAEPVDQTERQLQAEHHQAAESAAQAANEAATTVQTEPDKPRGELQAAFLAGNLGKTITVFLTNGVRLNGKLAQYNQYCLLLKNGNEQQMVFKHVVATIIPTAR